MTAAPASTGDATAGAGRSSPAARLDRTIYGPGSIAVLSFERCEPARETLGGEAARRARERRPPADPCPSGGGRLARACACRRHSTRRPGGRRVHTFRTSRMSPSFSYKRCIRAEASDQHARRRSAAQGSVQTDGGTLKYRRPLPTGLAARHEHWAQLAIGTARPNSPVRRSGRRRPSIGIDERRSALRVARAAGPSADGRRSVSWRDRVRRRRPTTDPRQGHQVPSDRGRPHAGYETRRRDACPTTPLLIQCYHRRAFSRGWRNW
jgi:hypothetical protein